MNLLFMCCNWIKQKCQVNENFSISASVFQLYKDTDVRIPSKFFFKVVNS